MTFTLSDCMERINQILNYPSAVYSDVSQFFDQAISELNTSLHIDLPPISVLVNKYKNPSFSGNGVILLAQAPTAATSIPAYENETAADTASTSYYYDTSAKTYKVKVSGTWVAYSKLYAVYNNVSDGTVVTYSACYISASAIVWTVFVNDPETCINLLDYFTFDWIILFIIPYVCFKYSVRNGEDGALYSDEFVQGFQQLQLAYDIPEQVSLVDVVGCPAYEDDVAGNLENLHKAVTVKAITNRMRTGRVHHATFGDINDAGGWGI